MNPSIPGLTRPPTALPTEAELLADWLAHCGTDERDPIGPKGEPAYRYFWNTWLQYLKTGAHGRQPEPLAWHEVQALDVLGFLRSGPRARQSGARVSEITRRRYWRLLERIYAHALHRGWVSSNPAQDLAEADIPPQEDPQGAILAPAVWQALEALLDEGAAPREPKEVRKRAMLCCLLELGLMPMEVRGLSLASLQYEPPGQDGTEPLLRALQLEGAGLHQRRRLPLSPRARRALQDWLALRSQLACSAEVPALFCTPQAARKGGQGEMSAITLLKWARGLIELAAQRAAYPPPPRLGPQIIRNTCLVRWLNAGMPVGEVLARAGLKSVKGLYHLRDHLGPGVSLSVARGGEVVGERASPGDG